MLSVFVGAGSQVLLCAFITLGFFFFNLYFSNNFLKLLPVLDFCHQQIVAL